MIFIITNKGSVIMKKVIRDSIILIIVFCTVSFGVPSLVDYIVYVKQDYFDFGEKKLEYKDIFYEPKSKTQEIYGIGAFSYIDYEELREQPELIEYYDDMKIRTFEIGTINELINLLRACEYSYIPDKHDAYKILNKMNKNNAVTCVSLQSVWFDKEDSHFSSNLLEEVVDQAFAAEFASIYSLNGDLYLVADIVNGIDYNVYRGYELPSFGQTSKAVFKIEYSESTKTILEKKSDFYVYKAYYYEDSSIGFASISLGIVITMVCALISVKRRKK